jgi:hypothetical protein
MNAKYFIRPCWLTLFISMLLVPLAVVGMKFTPIVFRVLHIDNGKPPGPMDLVGLAFALLWIAGYIGMAVASIWCLADAIVLYFRSHRGKQARQS